MKLSTILISTLAAFATAHVGRSAEPEPVELKDLVKQISKVPGLGAAKGMVKCIARDPTWKADYSNKNNGEVTFSSVTMKCCKKAQAGWTKYGDHWSKFAHATFNDPCTGGQFSNMTEGNIDMLRAMIGNGHW